ncbi:glycosyltransferase [Roseomonas sp. GCM10028921]
MTGPARICIGIPVRDGPELLLATLASLQAQTACRADLVLLSDGPDAGAQAALSALPDIAQWNTPGRRGNAACFNRLAAGSHAAVLVLLENGACVGPGWLDHLMAALEAEPRTGLAGPSTNHCWNEQGAYSGRSGAPEAIAATAREAARRFGRSLQPLTPLHSLAEFCYVVRREVVDAVGAADEAYGTGPCWEMDYNIRAARAGWRGVWAGAAYVWRAPWPPGRLQEEQRGFDASRHRYQDRFCALRLRATSTGYEPHCRGEACEHFAPPALMPPRAPLPTWQPPCAPAPLMPLVSCVMPTRGRTAFALQAIRYFQRQDYPNRELIILDEGEQDLAAPVAGDPRIRRERVPAGLAIGAKRNRGCALARGSIVAHWDDDDWYGPDRLSRQLAPILSGEADITGLRDSVFFDLPGGRFWRCSPALHARLFVQDVHGGTLVFQRRLWEQVAQYPEISLAEDAWFLQRAIAGGAKLARVPADGCYVYLRHGGNAWRFACGTYLDPAGWEQAAEPELPEADRAFYRAAGALAAAPFPAPPAAAPALSSPLVAGAPLVSCIMPTADRPRFAERAIRYFQRQDWPNRELVIVDDGERPIAELAEGRERVRYIRLDGRSRVGVKRNLACEQARGDIIAHWDDDDWYAPGRLRLQAEALAQMPHGICGVSELVYFDLCRRSAHLYAYPADQRPWLAGNALCYRREAWARNRFREVDVGEDALFVWAASPRDVVAVPDSSFIVGMIHEHNVSPKQVAGAFWRPYPAEAVAERLGQDWHDYALEPA